MASSFCFFTHRLKLATFPEAGMVKAFSVKATAIAGRTFNISFRKAEFISILCSIPIVQDVISGTG